MAAKNSNLCDKVTPILESMTNMIKTITRAPVSPPADEAGNLDAGRLKQTSSEVI